MADLEAITCTGCTSQLATVAADRRPAAATGNRADVLLTGGDCACIWCCTCERWQAWSHITATTGDRAAAKSRAHWLNFALSAA